MDARAPERESAPLHGLVTMRRWLALPLLVAVAASLLAGIAGGLLRTGIAVAGSHAWLPRAALAHAALMMCGFMGTVIGIERAVAARTAAAWIAPLGSGAAGICLIAGAREIAAALLLLAGVAFIAVNAVLLRRQRAAHTVLLLASAIAWAIGNLAWALDAPATSVLPWWFAFLVATVAAERLEMTRLMRRRPGAQASLFIALAALVAGAALSAWSPRAGGVCYGAALCAIAAWLFTFDIARRTVRADGLPRYMAVCLLAGYAWLAVGGIAWFATALGAPARDAALHAIALGFLVSMIMGHAPVILPAIARVKLLFGPTFYLPLAALHASLAWRLAGGFLDFRFRAEGALANAAALALFVATVLAAAWGWRRRHGGAAAVARTP